MSGMFSRVECLSLCKMFGGLYLLKTSTIKAGYFSFCFRLEFGKSLQARLTCPLIDYRHQPITARRPVSRLLYKADRVD